MPTLRGGAVHGFGTGGSCDVVPPRQASATNQSKLKDYQGFIIMGVTAIAITIGVMLVIKYSETDKQCQEYAGVNFEAFYETWSEEYNLPALHYHQQEELDKYYQCMDLNGYDERSKWEIKPVKEPDPLFKADLPEETK